MNRLANETSPYLLQHAHNPVDWYPWGEEALDRAKSEGKPILLSIGYAACHWCHVMERESFEDEQTARLMNENFVCIKVDREERPDIDSIYMDAVQAITGHGGWPMTMFLAPDGTPFYGGTYFPPEDAHGMPAFRKVLGAVSDSWRNRQAEIKAQGGKLVEHIRNLSRPSPSKEPLTSTLLTGAFTNIGANYDSEFGGFGAAPKFPQGPVLEFMLRGVPKDKEVDDMMRVTLELMARGGIYDQVGGGFHRYSVDRTWLVPHFEKMLYDNAQLARIYTRAWQIWKEPFHRRIAKETLNYLMRDMRDEAGGFYSSEDADSEGVEGKFYVWDFEELDALAPSAKEYYGVTRGGNFEGKNILTALKGDPPEVERARLFEAREKRIRPARDEKILTSWNGLTISALAEAGAAFDDPSLLDAARQASDFLLSEARSDGRVLHSYKDGEARVLGLLEDYAYLGEGLLTLWEATLEPRWYEESRSLVDNMLDLFWDDRDGGLFTTGHDAEELIVRPKEIVESATPSPNAVAALVLMKHAVLSGDHSLQSRGAEVLRVANDYMSRAPQATSTSLSALDFYLSTPKEVVLVASAGSSVEGELKRTIWEEFLPNRVVAGAPPGIDSPMLEGKESINSQVTAFVCENYVCKAPTTERSELQGQLRS